MNLHYREDFLGWLGPFNVLSLNESHKTGEMNARRFEWEYSYSYSWERWTVLLLVSLIIARPLLFPLCCSDQNALVSGASSTNSSPVSKLIFLRSSWRAKRFFHLRTEAYLQCYSSWVESNREKEINLFWSAYFRLSNSASLSEIFDNFGC